MVARERITEARTARFRGRELPDRPGWVVSTIARRRTNRNAAETCAVTGADVPLGKSHYFVVARKPGKEEAEYGVLVVADDALGELDVWLEDDEE